MNRWLQPALLVAMIVMGTLLFWRHRSNIVKLVRGTEGKLKN